MIEIIGSTAVQVLRLEGKFWAPSGCSVSQLVNVVTRVVALGRYEKIRAEPV